MRWILIALAVAVLAQLAWGAYASIAAPLYWSIGVALFITFWVMWIKYQPRPEQTKHDGEAGVGYCITLTLVTVGIAVGLAVAFRHDQPSITEMGLYLLINSLWPLGLAWIGWAKRGSEAGGYLFSTATVEFARTALPAAVYVHALFAALGFAQQLPLGSDDGPELMLVTSYLTKSASMSNPQPFVGVGPAKEGIQVLLEVTPEQFPNGWPSLLIVDVSFDATFHADWRISGASHAFVGPSTELVELLVNESNERQRLADVQWNTHNGFLEPQLVAHLVGLNTSETPSDLRNLPPIEVISPEEPTGVESLLLRELPSGPVTIQLVLERRTPESPQLDIGESLKRITAGEAFECDYRR